MNTSQVIKETEEKIRMLYERHKNLMKDYHEVPLYITLDIEYFESLLLILKTQLRKNKKR